MDDVDFPVVTPGTKVLVQLRDSTYYTTGSDGVYKARFERYPPFEKVIHDSDACWPTEGIDPQELLDTYGPEQPHAVTICPECIPSWANDYYITLGDTPAHLGIDSH